ncbi:hypothetical protein BU24DRAFT_469588 [Aaosphaeria arxii CBS 175.79]|uniref:Uncharacterized protein n=1 Tax=Aaosphaeria arxii CBS 175.79 TaxID=1450172 RepID=A0A6A5Y7L6_9PLEO|nr:uncharacterized protein BU24DRAFT_469588 [Aaosphaeria arxii CBS 175.79]KAF2020800.1 hypothetical protein BU24DRAFT_469588 [Aaosphaeria arxii CBS 175.79]
MNTYTYPGTKIDPNAQHAARRTGDEARHAASGTRYCNTRLINSLCLASTVEHNSMPIADSQPQWQRQLPFVSRAVPAQPYHHHYNRGVELIPTLNTPIHFSRPLNPPRSAITISWYPWDLSSSPSPPPSEASSSADSLADLAFNLSLNSPPLIPLKTPRPPQKAQEVHMARRLRPGELTPPGPWADGSWACGCQKAFTASKKMQFGLGIEDIHGNFHFGADDQYPVPPPTVIEPEQRGTEWLLRLGFGEFGFGDYTTEGPLNHPLGQKNVLDDGTIFNPGETLTISKDAAVLENNTPSQFPWHAAYGLNASTGQTQTNMPSSSPIPASDSNLIDPSTLFHGTDLLAWPQQPQTTTNISQSHYADLSSIDLDLNLDLNSHNLISFPSDDEDALTEIDFPFTSSPSIKPTTNDTGPTILHPTNPLITITTASPCAGPVVPIRPILAQKQSQQQVMQKQKQVHPPLKRQRSNDSGVVYKLPGVVGGRSGDGGRGRGGRGGDDKENELYHKAPYLYALKGVGNVGAGRDEDGGGVSLI